MSQTSEDGNLNQPEGQSAAPAVSVVVPAHNEAYLLSDCLAALASQDYRGAYEVIVVNNASTDHTSDIARAFGARVVDAPRKGYAHALRAGFSAARGRVIACTDADTTVPPDWITRLVADLLAQRDCVAVTGRFVFRDGPWWLRLLAHLLGGLNYQLAGGNMAVWRWAYHAVGGFDLGVNMGADRMLGLRLRRVGRIKVDRTLVARTSARRYEVAFWPAIRLYVLNDLSLVVLGRPHFVDFPDVRLPVHIRMHSRRVSRAGAALLPVLVLVLFVCFAESPGRQVLGAVLSRAAQDQPVVALTFDDGPSPCTAEVLDVLKENHVSATFFLIGKNVERYPDLARRIVAEGDCIGNHTYSHPAWAALEDSSRLRRELDSGERAIERTTGVHTTLFRPPHGWRSPWMIGQAQRLGYTVVTWSAAADDWRRPGAMVIARRILNQARPGVIFLLHDGLEMRASPPVQETVEALPAIIAGLKTRGYRLVTVTELMQQGVSAQTSGWYGPVTVGPWHTTLDLAQNR